MMTINDAAKAIKDLHDEHCGAYEHCDCPLWQAWELVKAASLAGLKAASPAGLTGVAIEILNDVHKHDKRAMQELLDRRVDVRAGLGLHEHIVVGVRPFGEMGPASDTIGMLGILNGILSRSGAPKVAMQIDENGKLISFCEYKG